MTNIAQILSAEFEALKDELTAKHQEVFKWTSRQWADSLNVFASQNSAEIVQASSSGTFEHNRAPGKPPPSEAIENWLSDKGIASGLEKKISVSSLAFLIARKIGREGWNNKWPDGHDFISLVVTPGRIQQIIDKIGESHIKDFSNTISGYLHALQT